MELRWNALSAWEVSRLGRCFDIPEVSESRIVDSAVALRAVVGTDNAVTAVRKETEF